MTLILSNSWILCFDQSQPKEESHDFPIPKIPHPLTPAHYRSISIAPVSTRFMERNFVSTFLYPALTSWPTLPGPGHFSRPTGLACGALSAILDCLCAMLTKHPYVSGCLGFRNSWLKLSYSVTFQAVQNLYIHLFFVCSCGMSTRNK